MSSSGTVARFAVQASHIAAQTIREIRGKAHDQSGAPKTGSRELTAWNLVRRVLDDVVPEAALDHRLALGEKGGVRFAGIYRARAGRLRMIWIASSALRRAIVLLVGVRKAGDQHDVYSELERLLRSGILDPCFERLGQTNPLR